VLERARAEPAVVRLRPAQQPHGAEQQVRLLLDRRQRREQRKQLGVRGDPQRQLDVELRAAPCLVGEAPVPLRQLLGHAPTACQPA
jgi:hypothetical protein